MWKTVLQISHIFWWDFWKSCVTVLLSAMSETERQPPSITDGDLREYRGRSGSPEGGPYIELRFMAMGDRIVETHWESNGCPAAQKAACGLAAFL